MIIIAAGMAACSKDVVMTPAVSLFGEVPEMTDSTAIFRMAVANMPDSTERRFPVVFGGTAERGIDYEATSDAFVFGGTSPVEAIVVKTLVYGTGKTVSLTLNLPENIEGGKYLTAGYTLQEEDPNQPEE